MIKFFAPSLCESSSMITTEKIYTFSLSSTVLVCIFLQIRYVTYLQNQQKQDKKLRRLSYGHDSKWKNFLVNT